MEEIESSLNETVDTLAETITDEQNALELCNKVAIIKDGILIKDGKMDEIVKDGDSLEDIFMEVVCDDKAD